MISAMRAEQDSRVSDHETRVRLTTAYDALPAPVRQALRECAWDVHIARRIPPDMDCTALIAAIKRIASEKDAIAFTRANAPYRSR